MSRGNDVTIVLVLNRILALIDLNFGNALRGAYFGCLSYAKVSQKSMRGISRYFGSSKKWL